MSAGFQKLSICLMKNKQSVHSIPKRSCFLFVSIPQVFLIHTTVVMTIAIQKKPLRGRKPSNKKSAITKTVSYRLRLDLSLQLVTLCSFSSVNNFFLSFFFTSVKGVGKERTKYSLDFLLIPLNEHWLSWRIICLESNSQQKMKFLLTLSPLDQTFK